MPGLSIFLLLAFLFWNQSPKMVAQELDSNTTLSIWNLEAHGIEEGDSLEYINFLSYLLKAKTDLRVILPGYQVLETVPEVNLTGSLSRDDASYYLQLNITEGFSEDPLESYNESYDGMGDLYEDCSRIAGDIGSLYYQRTFLWRSPRQSYVFQAKVYRNQFSEYLELVNSIEEQPGISEELKSEIAAFRRKKIGHGFGMFLSLSGCVAMLVGEFGLIFTLADIIEDDLPAEPILGSMFIGGISMMLLGSHLMDPKPQAVVDRYNQLLKQ
ncbi:hypothetical protein ES703_23783 [subsurface metagenome]